MPFDLKIFGSNSATPAFNRHQTSQLLKVNGKNFLIDCGEGTQIQISRYREKLNKIRYIFISHLHGDHYLGLIGLISTMHLYGRKTELYIFGPPGLSEIITIQLKYSETVLNFPVHFQELDTTVHKEILDLDNITVSTIPLSHRIPCSGFLFREKPKKPRLDKEKLPEGLSLQEVAMLKKGEDIVDDKGDIKLKCSDVILPPKKSRAYAYCSDTKYLEENIALVKGADLLYHESTFLDDLRDRAKQTFHTTAKEAGEFAKKAQVGKLLLGHFSTRYKDLDPLLEEAREVFPESHLAIEGKTFSVSDEP